MSVSRSPTHIQPFRRVLTAAVLLWIVQLGIMAWFMVGQGYDRSTAAMLPWFGLLLVPVMAVLMRAGMPPWSPSRSIRMARSVAVAGILYLIGVLVPGWIVTTVMHLDSPFTELWSILTMSTALVVLGLVGHKAPPHLRWHFLAVLILSGAAGWMLVRRIVFSFF